MHVASTKWTHTLTPPHTHAHTHTCLTSGLLRRSSVRGCRRAVRPPAVRPSVAAAAASVRGCHRCPRPPSQAATLPRLELLPHLAVLELIDTNVTAAQLAQLTACSGLAELALVRCGPRSEAPPYRSIGVALPPLAALPSLVALQLVGYGAAATAAATSSATASATAAAAASTSAAAPSAAGPERHNCRFPDLSCPSLASRLTLLTVRNCAVSAEQLAPLSGLTALKELYVAGLQVRSRDQLVRDKTTYLPKRVRFYSVGRQLRHIVSFTQFTTVVTVLCHPAANHYDITVITTTTLIMHQKNTNA